MLPVRDKLLERLVLKKVIFPCVFYRVKPRVHSTCISHPDSGTTAALVTVYHRIEEVVHPRQHGEKIR